MPLPSIEIILLAAAVLLFLSVTASKVSDRFGVPALLIFLLIGMLAGSEGIGRIYFNNHWVAQSLGVVALIFILFSGGVETKIADIKPILIPGLILSTLGVMLTAVFVALFASTVLNFTFLEGMLLGSIISSTDAATVFTILRSKSVNLKGKLRPLLELESGSNDPMAVFLTLGMIRLLTVENYTISNLFVSFVLEVVIGIAVAIIMSRFTLFAINRLQLGYEGLYPALTISLTMLTYALTAMLKGNGFLAVYLMALLLGNKEFLHKKTLIRFHEGIAWLMQIVMFLTLGLLVFPSQIVPILPQGLIISIFLVLVARPVSVWLCLLFNKMSPSEKHLISWVGLRGAVPIILATFPLIAHVPKADMMFNIVFFIVLTSILFQGTSIPAVSEFLKVSIPLPHRPASPILFERNDTIDADLQEVIVPFGSAIVGKRLFESGIPAGCLVVLICREEKFFIPKGTTPLEDGDVLMVLAKDEDLRQLQAVFSGKETA